MYRFDASILIATLADPLPISQVSKLLGPGQGRNVDKLLTQLRSIIHAPTDSSLPMNTYHSSVRDYVSHRSNCSLRQVQHITSPHSLFAPSSFCLMMRDLPDHTALTKLCNPGRPQFENLIFQPPEPLQVLMGRKYYACALLGTNLVTSH